MMMDTDFNFATLLKELRLERDLSQENLARQLEVTTRNYRKWETGIGFPTFNYIRRLCLLFNVSADYLLGLTDKQLPIDR